MKKKTSFIIWILIISLIVPTVLTACGSSETVSGESYVYGKKIGVLKGTTAAACTDGAGTLKEYETEETMIEDLKSGAIDCIITDDETAERMTDTYSKIKIYSEPYALLHFSFAVAKENADLTERINSALAELSESGVLQNIIDSYISDVDYTYTPPEDVESAGGTLTLAVADDFEPYCYENSSKKIRGIDVDIATAVCDLLGVELEIVSADRSSLVPMVQRGEVSFAAGGLIVTDEALENVNFTDSYAVSEQVIIISK
jgi:ABC-type amino acid transport substrate-binding protein